MYVAEQDSEPDTPPGYYENGHIPVDYLEPEYEPMPEDDHVPEYEPLPEDEPIPEYEPETPTGSQEIQSEDMTDVELEQQQPAASTESVAPRNAPPRIDPAPNQNTHGQAIDALQHEVQHMRNELHILQMHFFNFIDTRWRLVNENPQENQPEHHNEPVDAMEQEFNQAQADFNQPPQNNPPPITLDAIWPVVAPPLGGFARSLASIAPLLGELAAPSNTQSQYASTPIGPAAFEMCPHQTCLYVELFARRPPAVPV
ncbi:early nodulin-75-like [Vicia villosa]|uniref:early nodulin-75-like n=1 Tax=Vicia villosa TaxID=3911 RepID=UPI00273B9DE1|nr:early nodulin-75-like [Vicia villosa]